MKAPKNFDKTRLNAANVEDYIKKKYNVAKIMQSSARVLDVVPLLQNDYGEVNDCTLTSITTCVNYYRGAKDNVNEIYDYVEKIAKKYFYKGNIGTIPLFTQKIYDEVLKKYSCRKKKTSQAYLKGVGFNFNTIKKLIDKETPIILSVNNDGRNYYRNHSITIVGYRTYKINNNTTSKLLVVFDNWTKVICFVDYDVLPAIASINY